MRKQLSSNFFRMWRSHTFWLFLGGMLCLSSIFIMMQYTAMDYTVPLSRVIFLPLSLYGMAAAAFVSVFVYSIFHSRNWHEYCLWKYLLHDYSALRQ